MLNSYVKEQLLPISREPLELMFRVSSCRPGALYSVPVAFHAGEDLWADCEGKLSRIQDFKESTYREEQLVETDFGDKWTPTNKVLQRYAIRQVMSPFNARSTLRWLQNIDKAELWVQTLLFVALTVPVPQDDSRLTPVIVAQQNAAEWMRADYSINKTAVLSDEQTIAPLEFWTVGMRLSYYQKHSKMQKLMALDFGQNELMQICHERMPSVGDIIPFEQETNGTKNDQ